MSLLRRLAIAASFGIVALASFSPVNAETVLRRANQAEPETLDPQKTTGVYEATIETDLFEGLVTLDADRKPVPGAAERWETSPDGTVWTFYLRAGQKWSNGDPLTADDFVYAFRRLVDPATGAADFDPLHEVVTAQEIVAGKERDLGKLGVQALDPLTLRITLTHPRVILPLLMTDIAAFPLHKASIERYGNQWTRPGNIVTNGAYTLDSAVSHDQIVLKKNPEFHDADAVQIDTVRYILADNDATAFKRFRNGELDTTVAPLKELPWIRENMKPEFHSGLGLGVSFVFFNMTKGPFFDNPKLREALSLTVDREVLVTKVSPRGQQPAYGLVPPTVPDYTSQPVFFKDMPKEERLALARKLYAEAGYGPQNPLKFSLLYTTDEELRVFLLAIASMWKTALGIEVKLENREWQVFLNAVRQKDFDTGIMGTLATYADAEGFFDNYRSDAGFYNHSGYTNPAFDSLLATSKQAIDMGVRRDLLQQSERLLMTEMPIIPIQFSAINRLVSTRVSGWRDAISFPASRYLSVKE